MQPQPTFDDCGKGLTEQQSNTYPVGLQAPERLSNKRLYTGTWDPMLDLTTAFSNQLMQG